MKREIKKKLEDGLSKTVESYIDDSIDIMDPAKLKVLTILSREIKLLSDEESLKKNDDLRKEKQTYEIERGREQIDLEKNKFDLEKEKYYNQVEHENIKFILEQNKFEHAKELEIRKLDIEEQKIKLEYARLEVEKGVKLDEKKKTKWNFIAGILMDVAKVSLPLILYWKLNNCQLKLIYQENGIVPSTMKEWSKNVSQLMKK